MPRPITEKTIQEHFECTCGYNSVQQEQLTIKHADLIKGGLKRKNDKETKEVFYLHLIKSETCNCNDFDMYP